MSNLTRTTKRMLRTRGALGAAATALGVGIFWAGSGLLSVLISATGLVGVDIPQGTLPNPVAGFGAFALATILPFTVGYFVALWTVAPITEQLGVGHVITRAVLATGIGITLAFVVSTIAQVMIGLAETYPLLLDVDTPDFVASLMLDSLRNAGGTFLSVLPLGVLGGVLLWVRRTAKPSEHHIEGLIDV